MNRERLERCQWDELSGKLYYIWNRSSMTWTLFHLVNKGGRILVNFLEAVPATYNFSRYYVWGGETQCLETKLLLGGKLTPYLLPLWQPTVRNWEKEMAQQCIISPNLEWENKNLEISDIKMRNAGNSGFVFLNCILLCPPKKSKFRHSILADAELSFTFWTDLANFLHIVLGAIVDGMRDPTLTDGLMFACWRGAEHGHIFHSLAQLSGCNANATWREGKINQRLIQGNESVGFDLSSPQTLLTRLDFRV